MTKSSPFRSSLERSGFRRVCGDWRQRNLRKVAEHFQWDPVKLAGRDPARERKLKS
jgi:hypothetical protein